MAHRLEITLSDEQNARLEQARGHEPRASYVKRALESALAGPCPGTPAAVPNPRGSGSVKEARATEQPASTRTPARGFNRVTTLER
jgi:hypothetical protein